ncbi:nuclear transport factor 2 family protein [Rhizobacter sp. Root1221]|uniref:nuclear transport factor 2 family protein n=1 Tax=Rhizobacter sp. Root1221 TaxID=1736433 RepID=UPI0006F5BB32|nr:nuclear transport factor 2 family protein [Rhizobacter sp. Root1221]KQW00792.1 ketosteroid isomerase [Rhizobacter sp. Root1221]
MTTDNKQRMQAIFDELAKGNGRPLVDAMADDFCWTIAGVSAWSRTWRGKQAVRQELLRPLFARFADTYTSTAWRVVAEGDLVVVEARGKVTTRAGARYDNHYCFVCRLEGGLLREITEYMDTDLAVSVLGVPEPTVATA